MIDHMSIRVRNYEASKKFYLAALGPLGYTAIMEFGPVAGLGADGKPDFWVAQAEGEPTGPIHLAFRARNRAAVDEFYRAAIAAGAKDNGAPGLRAQYHPNYYGAFVHDPNGHNLEVVCHDPA